MKSYVLPDSLSSFCDVHMPADAIDPILIKPVRNAVHEWMTEINMTAELQKIDIKPRRTALLYGPPGCGKTTLAHHFAARLGMPLISVKMDTLRSCYVGQTGNQIGALFNSMNQSQTPTILFLDEFDAIATSRLSASQQADKESNAIVNALLVRIEEYDGICIAATNRGDDIDPALWRRFDLHLDIGLPGHEERFAILNKYLHPYILLENDIDSLAAELEGAPPSLLKQIMEGIKRTLILNPPLGRSIDLETVIRQVLVSVKPHASYKTPSLWTAVDGPVPDISWPPQIWSPQT